MCLRMVRPDMAEQNSASAMRSDSSCCGDRSSSSLAPRSACGIASQMDCTADLAQTVVLRVCQTLDPPLVMDADRRLR